MEIHPLEYIVEAARHNSLTQAARELGVSQSTLSRAIAGVSRDIGAPLFARGKRLELTEVGRKYVEAARQIIEIKQLTYRQIQALDNEGQHLSVGLSPHLDLQVLSDYLGDYLKEYPQVRVSVTESYSLEAAEMVARGKLDMSIGIQDEAFAERHGLRFIPMMWVTYLLAVPEVNPLSAGGAAQAAADTPVRKLEAFRNMPFIGVDARSLGYLRMREYFQIAGFAPLEISMAARVSYTRMLIRDYNAYGMLPMDECAAGVGLRYFRSDPDFRILKGFYVRRHYRVTPQAAAFMDQFTRALRRRYRLSAELEPAVAAEEGGKTGV